MGASYKQHLLVVTSLMAIAGCAFLATLTHKVNRLAETSEQAARISKNSSVLTSVKKEAGYFVIRGQVATVTEQSNLDNGRHFTVKGVAQTIMVCGVGYVAPVGELCPKKQDIPKVGDKVEVKIRQKDRSLVNCSECYIIKL